MEIKQFLTSNKWEIVETLSIPPREAQFHKVDDLSLSKASMSLLNDDKYKNGLYLHQKEAIRLSQQGENVCLATGTASGKTLSFHVAAIERLIKNPMSKIIAIYPMKALGREQETRWENALSKAGLNAKVGRIDGSVPQKTRLNILATSHVIVVTPDIIHAWLLSNLSNKDVLLFLKRVSLIVVDEVHTYTGVFGSNSAFLFRRLQHLLAMLGAFPKYICASATIADPQKHLRSLLGLDVTIIGREMDSSPKQEVDIHLVNPPSEADFLSEVVKLLKPLHRNTGKRFITFVDSRKQVELIAAIIDRESKADSSDDSLSDTDIESNKESDVNDDGNEAPLVSDEAMKVLNRIDVLPYRAGYEERDRAKIQERLSQGKLNGIVSTSALELGIDIPYLEMCVLVGVPTSSTSLHQRIGRIGRHSKGDVIVINSGDVYDQAVFSDPKSLLDRPMAESALYLENTYIQYIHALCLARLYGEHDQITKKSESEFSSPVNWPDNFLSLCAKERSGQIPRELQSMKSDAGDSPNHTFPLRDVESQFKIEYRQGFTKESLGSLSYGQLMREAYPGAVYYYATLPYRVTRVNINSKTVEVRKEKRYTTKPQALPTLIFPNLSQDNVFQSFSQGDLSCFESNLQVRESINGIKERRGPTEKTYSYPLPATLGFYFDLPYFTRNYFTTGIVISHPALNKDSVDCRAISELFYEAFLLLIPFERQDINHATDKFRLKVSPIEEGHKFIAIYDQTYGSLRLTNRIMESSILRDILIETRKLADKQEWPEAKKLATLDALDELVEATKKPVYSVNLGIDETLRADTNSVRVIMPESKGLLLTKNNEEFIVNRVFLKPGGLHYEGVTSNMQATTTAVLLPPIEHVVEIPGESKVGLYNYDTGKIDEITIEKDTAKSIPVSTRAIDTEKLKFVLLEYFDDEQMNELCTTIGINHQIFGDGNKARKVDSLVSYAEKVGYTDWLLKEAFIMYKNRQSAPTQESA